MRISTIFSSILRMGRGRKVEPQAPVAPVTEFPHGQQLLALGATKDDLLQILDENRGEEVLCQFVADTLLTQYADELTLEELDEIVVYTTGDVQEDAGRIVLKRATNKEQIASVLLNVPLLQVEAAQRTLAQNPNSFDLHRCLAIPEVQEEALERLLRSNPSRQILLHLVRYGERKYPNFKELIEPAVRKHIADRKKRIDLTPAMYEVIRSLSAESQH